jgi:hypothetical protein
MAYGACQLRVHYTDFSSIIVALPAYESIQLWKHHRREEKSLPVISTPTIQSPRADTGKVGAMGFSRLEVKVIQYVKQVIPIL